ncbi:nucleotidyltransferase domain-containing protein (plasmid) [Pantoea agglomerans]|uniref:nucleotidyltransferase domain-containing protein n=1 Tax=Enterobacter agglomerans TaxID=549 RepID=UPI00177E4CFA|nr:nucleotidyltransferase domain-containing protein [Pantoea agglomerans]WVL92411.1 nucleotidyltransferase domain-containing protein [Pantoea agglomerans]
MAVDKYGFITQPDFKGFQPAFSQLVADVIQTLTTTFPDLIHSVYVYGSIIDATANKRLSDLDLTVIYYREPDADATAKIDVVKTTLELNHPVVSKIDIDPGVLEEVMLPANDIRWGYWLKHHCVCVYGEDLRARFEPFRPSRDIAVAVNGDFLEVLNGYVALMKPTLKPAQRHVLQRSAARKAIRLTNILREDNDQDWPVTLKELGKKFNDRYPALAEEMDYLLSISHRPRGDIMVFASRITTFSYWLNAEFHTRQR